MSQSGEREKKGCLFINFFVVLPVDVPLRTCLWSHDIFRPLLVIHAASEFTQRWPFHACYLAESLRETRDSFFSVALVVINLLVRQFRAEEGFSLGVQVWVGKANPLFARWKRLFSLARWWMRCLGCVALLALSLLRSHYSPLVSVLFCFLLYYASRSFSSLCFLLSSPTVSHTESIANYFISLPSFPPLSPSFPSFMSSCLSFHSGSAVGWAMGCNTGHGSCLSSPLVSCVAASGAASLPLCLSAGLSAHCCWTEIPRAAGSHQPWSCWLCCWLYI